MSKANRDCFQFEFIHPVFYKISRYFIHLDWRTIIFVGIEPKFYKNKLIIKWQKENCK